MTDNKMNELILEEKRQYHKKWRDAHKDKIKQYNKNYWQKKVLQRVQERSLQCNEQTTNENSAAGN